MLNFIIVSLIKVFTIIALFKICCNLVPNIIKKPFKGFFNIGYKMIKYTFNKIKCDIFENIQDETNIQNQNILNSKVIPLKKKDIL